ncbi:MAG: hypothetical protein ACK2T2_06290 [Anaerolineales bacterium]
MKTRLPAVLALTLALLAVALSAYISSSVFERMPHLEDEFANLWQAQVYAQGHLSLPSPEEPRSYLVPFVIDFQGQRFGKYPPGWPAALSLGARAGAAWLVNPILAGLAVWLTFRLGSKLLGEWPGFLAALLLLSSPMFLMLSASLMSHTFSLVLGLVFTLAWLDLFLHPEQPAARRGSRPALLTILSGMSLGLLALTRPWTAAALAAPFLIHALFRFVRGGRIDRLRLTAIAALAGVLAAGIPLWQFAVTGDPFLNPYTLWWPYDRLGFGAGIGVTESGHSLYWAWYNTRFSLRAGMHDLFGWPYLSWLFIPLGCWALRRDRRVWLLLGIPLALILFYAAYWIGSWLFGPRYYAEALPALAVFSAAGIAWLGGWIDSAARVSRWRRLAIFGLAALLLSVDAVGYIPARVAGMRGLYHITRRPSAWIAEQHLGSALIIVHAERWFQYAQLLPLVPPFSKSDLRVAWSRSPEADAALVETEPGRMVYRYDAITGSLSVYTP